MDPFPNSFDALLIHDSVGWCVLPKTGENWFLASAINRRLVPTRQPLFSPTARIRVYNVWVASQSSNYRPYYEDF